MTVWRKTSLGKVTGIATGELGRIFLSQNGTCSPSTSRPCLFCGQHHVGTDLALMCRKDTREGPSALLLTQPCHLPTHKPDRWSFLPPGGDPAGPARGMSLGQGVEHTRAGEQRTAPPSTPSPTPPDPTPTAVLTPCHDCFRGRRGLEEPLHRGPEREIWWWLQEEHGWHYSNSPLPILLRKKKHQI